MRRSSINEERKCGTAFDEKHLYFAYLFDFRPAFANDRSTLTGRNDQSKSDRRNRRARLFQILRKRNATRSGSGACGKWIYIFEFLTNHIESFGQRFDRSDHRDDAFGRCSITDINSSTALERREASMFCPLRRRIYFFSNSFDIITTFANDTSDFLNAPIGRPWGKEFGSVNWLCLASRDE